MGECVLEVLPHALDADVALRAGQHRLHLVLELGGHHEAGLGVRRVVLRERLDRAHLHVAPLNVAPDGSKQFFLANYHLGESWINRGINVQIHEYTSPSI